MQRVRQPVHDQGQPQGPLPAPLPELPPRPDEPEPGARAFRQVLPAPPQAH